MSVNTIVSTIVIAAFALSKAQCCDASYPIAVDNLGPKPSRLPPVGTVHTTPVIEKPVIRLPAVIPYPKTVSNKCRCMKTIVKPQVIHQVINVPSIQRYIETSHRPVVEKIHYSAYPVNAGVRDNYGNNYYYDDGAYSDSYSDCGCCCAYQDVCSLPVVGAMPVAASIPVAASLPVTRRFAVRCTC